MEKYSADYRPRYNDLVALGRVPGVFPLNKYGRNTNVDATATDIWDLYTQPIWLAPTAARIHAIVSSSIADTLLGTGARTIRVFGLVNWDTNEAWEDIELAGTTPVNTVNPYVIIHRIKVLTWSTTGPNAGIIKATAETDGTITAQIVIGAGQTQMAIYGVPSTQTFLMDRIYASLNRSGGLTPLCDMTLLCNDTPDALTTKYKISHTYGLMGSGTSHRYVPYTQPKKFVGPCILKWQAFGSTTDLDVSGGFDGRLYNK